jgi:signal transduction histidine kinase
MKEDKLLKRTLFLMLSVAALIFASIVLFENFIDNQKNDGTIINLAGRQRMLSQKITKNCLLITAENDVERETRILEILKEDLHNFTSVQNKLKSLDNSPKIITLFSSFQKKYQKIIANAAKIMIAEKHQQQKYLLIILKNEPLYLKNMDTIVDTYTNQNRTKIVYFKKLFIFANSIIIIFLVFIVLFIIAPLIREKELSELKLKEALIKQKELNELKSRFISTASHEFKTPLSAINFAAGSIKKYWTKMEPVIRAEKLHKIENQVKHMTKLLDNILMVGQTEFAKKMNEPIALNLGTFIHEIIEEVHDSLGKSHEIVLIDAEDFTNTTIFIDEKLARNIFINIIGNAVKFSPDADKVTIEISSEKDYTVISVTDFGIGIQKSELTTIFKPFTRGENAALIQGTGLGLSIVKNAIDAIGGEIIVNSTIGNATTFILKIPKN